MRQRLCIQPLWISWRMAASMIGKPVRPSCQAASRCGSFSQGKWRHWGR